MVCLERTMSSLRIPKAKQELVLGQRTDCRWCTHAGSEAQWLSTAMRVEHHPQGGFELVPLVSSFGRYTSLGEVSLTQAQKTLGCWAPSTWPVWPHPRRCLFDS